MPQTGDGAKSSSHGLAWGGATKFAFTNAVMPGLVPGLHVLGAMGKDVDGRDKPGHDDVEATRYQIWLFSAAIPSRRTISAPTARASGLDPMRGLRNRRPDCNRITT